MGCDSCLLLVPFVVSAGGFLGRTFDVESIVFGNLMLHLLLIFGGNFLLGQQLLLWHGIARDAFTWVRCPWTKESGVHDIVWVRLKQLKLLQE